MISISKRSLWLLHGDWIGIDKRSERNVRGLLQHSGQKMDSGLLTTSSLRYSPPLSHPRSKWKGLNKPIP